MRRRLAHRLLRQNLVLRLPLRGPLLRRGLQHPFKVTPHGDPLPLLLPERLDLRAHRDLLARHLKVSDIHLVRELRQQARSVPVHRKVTVPPLRLGKFVQVDLRAPVALHDREAGLLEDIRRVPAVVANEADVPGNRDPSADSDPAQRAEPEFRKRNQASRSMRASRLHRAAGRLLKSVTRKGSASSIRCVHARVWERDAPRRRSRLLRYSASRAR